MSVAAQRLPSNFSINLGFLGGYNLNPEWAKRIGSCDRRSWDDALPRTNGSRRDRFVIIVVGFVKGDSVKPEVSRRRFWRRFVELSAVRDKRSSEGSSGSHPAVGHRLREVRRTSDNVR